MSTDSPLRDALRRVLRGDDLEQPAARLTMDLIMEGAATAAQIGALLAALRMKGETAAEIAGMAESMREHALRVELSLDAVDTCGTGGDGCGTFNISTAAALVAAGAGCAVAKHGNRSASSQCGSADVLEALGVAIELQPDAVCACVLQTGMGFMFAPLYHPAMRHAAPVRRELGVPTAFNILGPLANPARVRRQAIGVTSAETARTAAAVVHRLGHEHALVFHGPDGLDEIGLSGPTLCLEVTPDGVRESVIEPLDFGFERAPLQTLSGGDAAENAAIVARVLEGCDGPAREAVLLNAAAALVAGGTAATLTDGVAKAARAIDSGAARRVLQDLVRVSNELAEVGA